TEYGDFSNAGALNFVTKDEFPQNFAYASGGFFDTQRYVLGGSVPTDWAKNLLAGQIYYTNGPFENPQDYLTYNGFGKITFNATPEARSTISGVAYYGRWNGSGQIPSRAVDAGFLYTEPSNPYPPKGEPTGCAENPALCTPFNRFSAVDPTEGGSTDREIVQMLYTYTPTAEDTWSLQAYGSHYSLNLFSDFTFFQSTGLRFYRVGHEVMDNGGLGDVPSCDPSQPNFSCYIPGDGIDQSEDRWIWGGLGSYTKSWFLSGIPMQSKVAVGTRNDYISSLALYRQVRRERFFDVNLADVQESSLTGYLDQQIFLNDWIRLDLGLRGDVYFFNVSNKLPGQAPDPNFIAVPINGHSNGDGIASPKANLVVSPLLNTDFYLNFGTGFHSNDARGVVLTQTAPRHDCNY